MSEPSWESTQPASAALPELASTPTWEQTLGSEEYEGVVPALKAGAAGAARSASFGLSDQFLVRSGLVKSETLKALEEFQPEATIAGQVAGVAGAILAPQVGGAAALLGAPTRAVLGAGAAVGKAAVPLAEGLLAASSPAVRKIVATAAELGVGSALEGAAYGLGQSVSEQALGDPDLNAERVASNIGMSALLGAGIGATFGAVKGAIQVKYPAFLNGSDKAAIEAGNFEKTIEHSDLPEEQKGNVFKWLTKKRANASEIEKFAASEGLPVIKPQLSDNEIVEKSWDMLLHSPSIPGIKQQQIASEAWLGATKTLDNTLGSGAALSKKEMGDAFVKGFSEQIEQQAAPVRALYNEIEPYKQAITVKDTSTNRIANNVRKLIKEKSLIVDTPAHGFVNTMANGLETLESLQDLRNFRTSMWGAAGNDTSLKHLAGVITEKLESLEMRAIKNFAEKEMKTPEAKQKIIDLIAKSDDASTQWKSLRNNMEALGDVFGKRRIYGPQDFLDFLSDGVTAEKLASKVWQREDARFMSFLKKEYPTQFEQAKQFRINQIKQAATSPEGKLSPKAIFKAINKMQPEERAFLFSTAQLQKIKGAEAYLNSFPRNFNPSGTEYTRLFGEFMKGGEETIRGNIRDYALNKIVSNVDKFDPFAAQSVQALATLERLGNKSNAAVKSAVNSIFSEGSGKGGGFIASTIEERRKEYDKQKPLLSELNNDVDKLISKIGQSTDAIAAVAPNHARSIQSTMANATCLLYDKMPGNNVPQKALSDPYQPSDAEVSKWYKYFHAVQDPASVLKQVSNATITPEALEAVKVVYPKMLHDMQKQVMEKLIDHSHKGKKLPYKTKLSLSMFLGSDLVNSLDPMSMVANQSVLSTATQNRNANRTSQMMRVNQKGLDNMDVSNRYLTPMQKSAQRKDT